jgi:hypothetical protein
MDQLDSKDRRLEVSATVLGDVHQAIGEVRGIAETTLELVGQVAQRQVGMAGQLIKLQSEHDARMESGCGDASPQRSPSDMYRAVDKHVERHVEKVEDSLTERLHVTASQAARDAVSAEVEQRVTAESARLKVEREERAAALKAATEQRLAEIDMAHRRAMGWIKIVAAALAILGGGGSVAYVRSLLSGEAEQVKVETILKRIEAKQARPIVVVRRPDAGE